jgi:hypothetical protein
MKRTQLRRAITDIQVPTFTYFQAFQNHSSPKIDTPPPYDEFADAPLPAPRFKVEPRPEEGKERLPAYHCSIRREGIFERKVELESPFERAYDRKWSKVYVVLNNTILSIHKPKRVAPGTKGSIEDETDSYICGSAIKSYTLQHTEVGAATDYKKKSFVIRIRAETQQFLLSCDTVDIFMDWLEALSSGIDLALPLEERSLPKYQTIPRRRRRRRAAEVVQQQEEIIRQHFPQLLNDNQREQLAASNASSPTTGRPQTSRGSSGGIDAVEESANVPDIEDTSRPQEVERAEEERLTLREFQELSLGMPTIAEAERRPSTADATSAAAIMDNMRHIAELANNRPASANPSSEGNTGKWRPGSRVTREAQLRFARRCMAVLTADAPRQSDYVMHGGTRYKLDYEMRTMIRDTTVEKKSEKSGLRSIIRA